MKNKITFLLLGLFFLSCSKDEDIKEPEAANTKNIEEADYASRTNSGSCETAPYTVRHAFGSSWSRTLALPATGKFVEESHYVTTLDVFPNGRLWANSVTENITAHLQRAHAIYKTYDPDKTFAQLYSASYQKQWTPAESGSIGQGSVGAIQKTELTPEKAMWFMTMMWAPGTIPARGTKFLLSANGKKVVVIAGYETGPRAQTYIGGLTPETHEWLGTNSASQITVSYLKNQSTPIGPITCGTISSVPVLNTPAAGANVQSPANLSWTAVEGASCRIQISKVNTGWTAANGFTAESAPTANVPVNYSTPGLLNYTWPNQYTADANKPVSGNTYYWTVRSYSPATGTSSYSPVRSFRIN
ncbi:MAG TPA: hypothetical protein VFR70_01530 [Flavobacterium sp.]|nr:hypothetical protein [Flavobacterium sp.]